MSEYIWNIAEAELHALLIGSRKSVYTLDLETDHLIWSPNAASALRLPQITQTHTGAQLRQLMYDADCATRDHWINDPDSRGSIGGEYRLAETPSSHRWIEEKITRLENPNRIIGMLSDIHERREREELTAYLASYDQLTGLLSRTKLREKLAQAVALSYKENRAMSFLLIGLDNIIGINEAYGYDVADEVVVNLSRRIQKCLKIDEFLGRVSGAKFGCISTAKTPLQITETANKIRSAIRETVVETHAGPVASTVSVGAVLLPLHGIATHDAMASAEEALTEAREASPDSVRIFQPCLKKERRRNQNITIAEQIISAYSENRLLVAYQPVVRSDNTEQVAFYECLIRMRSKEKSLIPAQDFMPVAERLGLVRMLDRFVMEIAFNNLRQVPNLRLSINISPQSAQDPVWLESFLRLAKGNQDVLARLIVEITESTAIKDAKQTARVVNQLRTYGCAFALDDFGAGYTSFRHFKDLKVDMVKIDGTFVRGIAENSHNQLFVKALTDIAQNFDMMTVAEMVSTEEDVAILRKLGIDAFQGYMYGKPEIEPEWLQSALKAAPKIQQS